MSRLLESSVPLAMENNGADAPNHLPPSPARFNRRRLNQRRLADLLPRLLSSLVLAALALVAVWRGGAAFAIIWFGATVALGLEWQNLIGGARRRIRFIVVALALALATAFSSQDRFGLACAILGLAGVALALAAGPGRRIWASAGIVYSGALIVSVSALYFSPNFGARAIIWLFATVWGTDVFAYFGGRLIGGPKLWPKISPSKTWSGTLVGVCAGALIGALIGVHGLANAWIALPLFVLGLVTATVSQGGDIFESFVKRCFNVKDSSVLIPGHGGFMDRLDGFIAASTFAALVGASRGLASIAAGLFDWL
jgi:phosphatidate cytidylyltransferase